MGSRRRVSRLSRPSFVALVVAVVVAAIGCGIGSWAAYRALVQNSGNAIAAGTVAVGDNDGGSAKLSLSSALPGDSDTDCIKVTYTGSLASTVRLYGTTTGTGLDPYLDLKVTRGTYSPSDPGDGSCTNFSADGTDYIGAGAGVIYNGTLQGYADTYAAGLVDPTSGSPESWTTNEAHVYKLQVTLQDNSAAENKTANQNFAWEARNQ
jgi:hypothetical protein